VRAETGELPGGEAVSPGLFHSDDSYGDSAYSSGAGDFSEVQGQDRYKRALEIAATGGHNLLVFGPPGSGKTMLARRFPSIMPPLTPGEAVEVTRLHSLAGQIANPQRETAHRSNDTFGPGAESHSGSCLIREPPFRSPHHSASVEGILGGGRNIRPGEITLAHLGILFLDEAPEFRKPVLQSLREPLEDRVVTIVRAEGHQKLPADFQLILAANSCPCGRLGADSAKSMAPSCFCSPDEINRHWRKLGSALLDRIDIRVPVRAPGILIPRGEGGEKSGEIRRRVVQAVEIQKERFKGSETRRNSGMSPGQMEKFCVLTKKAEEVFVLAAAKLSLSGRACHSILKVARSIADLEGKELIDTVHVLEAIQHRRFGDDPYDILAQP
jgi:magnesium chelatase family protein